MAQLIVRHKVEDYARWKQIFDGHAAARQAGGSQGGRLFRNANDPSELVIIWDWDSLDNARKFAGSDSLREAMMNAGVTDHPDIYFVEEVEKVAV